MRLYLRMLKYILPYWKTFLCGFVASLLYVAFNSISIWLTASFVEVIFPENQEQTIQTSGIANQQPKQLDVNDKLKELTDRIIIQETPLSTLRILCMTIFVTFFLKNIFFYLKGVSLGYIQLKFITDLRNKLYAHLHNLSLTFFNKKRAGEINSIILNDVGVMRRSLGTSFNKLLVEPINILTFTVLLFIISWKLTLIAIVILPVSGYVISKIGKSIRRKSLRTSKQIAGIMSIIQETLSGIRIVKAFAMEQFEKNRFFRETLKYFRLLFRRRKLRELSSPLNETFGVLIGAFLLFYGGTQVLSGSGLQGEDFVRFIIMLFAILNPIKNLNNVNIEIQKGLASATRVFSILDVEPDIIEDPSAQNINDFRDSIQYSDVHFKYDNSELEILTNINLKINKGEIVAIVGSSGAGKSTLVDLLPRFFDPYKGYIKIDGKNIKSLTLKSLRTLMGIVTQETILFNDTIFNNIAYGLTDTDPDLVKKAAEASNSLEFIKEQPDGFNTVIGDKGARLSGGQRQRIAIARALLKNPPILILDEATSSLDTESELKVQSAIDRLMKDRTVLVIAHRLATIQNAERIIVLDKGRIAETGNHDELMKKGGLYKHFFEMQLHGQLS